MILLRRTTLAALTTIALTMIALAAPLSAAQAADTVNWKTLATVMGSKIQACKVPVAPQGPWKIKLRVDATKASGRVMGSAYVTKKGAQTSDSWRSAWTNPGTISALGSVKLPAGEKYAIHAGIGTSGMGDGDTFTASNLPKC